MTAVALAVLGIAALVFAVRALVGPSLADRVMAVDGVLGCIALAIVVGVVRRDSRFDVDAVLLIALVAFVGTAVAAQFVERRDD